MCKKCQELAPTRETCTPRSNRSAINHQISQAVQRNHHIFPLNRHSLHTIAPKSSNAAALFQAHKVRSLPLPQRPHRRLQKFPSMAMQQQALLSPVEPQATPGRRNRNPLPLHSRTTPRPMKSALHIEQRNICGANSQTFHTHPSIHHFQPTSTKESAPSQEHRNPILSLPRNVGCRNLPLNGTLRCQSVRTRSMLPT